MLYILRSDNAYVAFDGVTEDQITTMLADQNLTCTFIDQAAFSAATNKK